MSSVAIAVCEDRDSDWVRADAMPQVINIATPRTAEVYLALAYARDAVERDARPSIDLDELLGFADSDPELSADVAQDLDNRWDD